MDSYTFLQTIMRHWKKIIILLFGAAIFIYVFLSYTIISINIKTHDGISGQATISASSTTRSMTPFSFFGIKILPREASVISATVDGYTTFKYVSLGLIYNSLSVDINRDTNANKYTGGVNQGCSTYNPTEDDLLSYNCSSADGLYAYSSNSDGSFDNKKVADVSTNTRAVPYLGGVIGISSTAVSQPIYFTSANSKTTYFDAPPNLSVNDLRNSAVVASPTMTDNTFLIATQAGDVYVGFINDNQVSYSKYAHPAGFDATSDSISCALTTNLATCYFGPSRNASSSKIRPSIVTITTSNKNQLTYQELPLSQPLYAENVALDRSGTFFIKDSTNLFMIKKNNNKADAIQLAHQVISFSADTNAYFVNDGKVYKVDSSNNSAYMIFQSPHLNAAAVTALGGSLFINARVDDGSATIHKYRLNDTPNDHSQKRLIDILPFKIDSKLPVSDTDFVKDTLYIQLKVTINKTGNFSNPIDAVDQSSLTSAKQQVQQYLDDSGVDTSTLKIIYGF